MRCLWGDASNWVMYIKIYFSCFMWMGILKQHDKLILSRAVGSILPVGEKLDFPLNFLSLVLQKLSSPLRRRWSCRSQLIVKSNWLLYFGPWVYQKGSLNPRSRIALVHVCVCSDILETAHYFLIFCMKLGHHKGTKVTEPDFWKKKILGGHKWENAHILGALFV